eukprot:4624512-Lingulodinium_polyedra.AAC.1
MSEGGDRTAVGSGQEEGDMPLGGQCAEGLAEGGPREHRGRVPEHVEFQYLGRSEAVPGGQVAQVGRTWGACKGVDQ